MIHNGKLTHTHTHTCDLHQQPHTWHHLALVPVQRPRASGPEATQLDPPVDSSVRRSTLLAAAMGWYSKGMIHDDSFLYRS